MPSSNRSSMASRCGWVSLVGNMALVRAHSEEDLAILHRLAVLGYGLDQGAAAFGLDLVHHLHGLDDADDGVRRNVLSGLEERLRIGRRRAVEGAHHGRGDFLEFFTAGGRGSGC